MIGNQLLQGDCLEVMRGLPDNSVDAVVTDPPYGLSFMGAKWDYDVPRVEVWRECLRVLKPGGHLLAFAGTRTQHRMAVNIEDAGFEIRDLVMWHYGAGFPKSHDISKAIDRAAGADREVVGVREDFAARAPKNNFDQFSAINPSERGINSQAFAAKMGQITAPATPAAKQWAGWGTALKPATEIVTMARKPFPGTVAANVLEWGTGGINVDGCRVGTESTIRNNNVSLGGSGNHIYGKAGACVAGSASGRWPANLIHDGSEEVVAGFPESSGGAFPKKIVGASPIAFRGDEVRDCRIELSDTGSAARFFYTAKASKSDRNEGLDDSNGHPTVKPTDLMRYLCRLVTPPGGVVLDPYMGSGSTGKAAYLEGFQFIGIEQDPAFVAIARARIAAAVQRSEMMTLEQRVAWLETQVQAQGAKLRKIEAHQQMSIFDALGATP